MNGSPVKPLAQIQMGLWCMTLHWASRPQVPIHGSTHFWFTHARFDPHSEFTKHSGLQFGGVPINWGKQEQMAWPLLSAHWLLGPQGEGWHGSRFSSGTTIMSYLKRYLRNFLLLFLSILYLIYLLRCNVTYCWESDKCSLYMDCRCNQGYKCKRERCWQLGNWYWYRMNRDMDSDILIRYKLNARDSLTKWYIRGGILRRDFQYTQTSMCKNQCRFVLYIQRLFHKGMVDKVSMLVVRLKES